MQLALSGLPQPMTWNEARFAWGEFNELNKAKVGGDGAEVSSTGRVGGLSRPGRTQSKRIYMSRPFWLKVPACTFLGFPALATLAESR